MTIGQRIKVARNAAGITQGDLGKRMGVSGSAIAQYETDNRNPKIETLQRIADALGVTPTYLIGYDEKIIKPEQYTPEQLAEFRAGAWEAYQQHIAETTGPRARVNAALNHLPEEGQEKVAIYAEDLIPRYCAETAPQPPVADSCNEDTTPPSPPPESPENAG